MTEFSLASFNVKNLISADQEYYRFERYTPEEYAWKKAWLSDQLVTLNADIVCFQEIFEEAALKAVVSEADAQGTALNSEVIPDRSKRYHRKAIFRKLQYKAYGDEGLFFAPNSFDAEPGNRRPGLAILSRNGFTEPPEVIQDLAEPLKIEFPELGGDGIAGSYKVSRLSRPIIKARVPVGDQVVTVFNCHFKSKLGEYLGNKSLGHAPEANLLDYDPLGRVVGELRSTLRRMAEAVVLRRLILAELAMGHPVFSLGDYNDADHSVSSAIVSGEKPFKNYAWMRRHDAQKHNDRYTDDEDKSIRAAIEVSQMINAEKLFVRKSLRDMVYTSAFGGVYESIDQILMSRHFSPDNPDAIGEMDYFTALNDHLTDGSHAEAPFNKLASDHGQIMAHMRLFV